MPNRLPKIPDPPHKGPWAPFATEEEYAEYEGQIYDDDQKANLRAGRRIKNVFVTKADYDKTEARLRREIAEEDAAKRQEEAEDLFNQMMSGSDFRPPRKGFVLPPNSRKDARK